MEQLRYQEMMNNLDELIQEHALQNKKIYLFGHCNATEELAKLLLSKGFSVAAVLDNNREKQGKVCLGISIQPPQVILQCSSDQTVVCIVARAYAAMADQLKRMGYTGPVRKLVDYNSYAEYSLSADTIARKRQRVERGKLFLQQLKKKYPGCFLLLCPFSALGDIYFMMSYLPHFMKRRNIEACMIGVIGQTCSQVVQLFGSYPVECFTQKDMDEAIQAALCTMDQVVFIPHQDRPYVVNLSKALYIRQISLEKIYCCGVFGLPLSTRPCSPVFWNQYGRLEEIEPDRSVILSPYAKSVTAFKQDIWERIIDYYQSRGYTCYTNVASGEEPLQGTLPISPLISEMRSVVERAGRFIGIRSGLCDVIREASCRKIALYPDYYYCDTKWKAVDMYRIEGWENIVVGEGV